ncbi:MAG: divalent-cation tolerance protein CutA [Deltaproteobacteria bacterium]|nr:divalent-cation tolerance protein CutA [Deltaproteobacteria bacterium]
MNTNLVYMTAGSKEEARKIGKALVTSRLAACVNIIDNMNSFYMWEGELQDDNEVVMLAKTTEDKGESGSVLKCDRQRDPRPVDAHKPNLPA